METTNPVSQQNVLLKKFIATFLPECRNEINQQKIELTKISIVLNNLFLTKFGYGTNIMEIYKAFYALRYSAFKIEAKYVVKTECPYLTSNCPIYYNINANNINDMRIIYNDEVNAIERQNLLRAAELEKQIEVFKKIHCQEAVLHWN